MKERSRGYCEHCETLTRHIKDVDAWRCMTCNAENYERE